MISGLTRTANLKSSRLTIARNMPKSTSDKLKSSFSLGITRILISWEHTTMDGSRLWWRLAWPSTTPRWRLITARAFWRESRSIFDDENWLNLSDSDSLILLSLISHLYGGVRPSKTITIQKIQERVQHQAGDSLKSHPYVDPCVLDHLCLSSDAFHSALYSAFGNSAFIQIVFNYVKRYVSCITNLIGLRIIFMLLGIFKFKCEGFKFFDRGYHIRNIDRPSSRSSQGTSEWLCTKTLSTSCTIAIYSILFL